MKWYIVYTYKNKNGSEKDLKEESRNKNENQTIVATQIRSLHL